MQPDKVAKVNPSQLRVARFLWANLSDTPSKLNYSDCATRLSMGKAYFATIVSLLKGEGILIGAGGMSALYSRGNPEITVRQGREMNGQMFSLNDDAAITKVWGPLSTGEAAPAKPPAEKTSRPGSSLRESLDETTSKGVQDINTLIESYEKARRGIDERLAKLQELRDILTEPF